MDNQLNNNLQHPGLLLKDYLENMKLTGTKVGELLKLDQTLISHIFNAKRSITASTSARIAAVFGDDPEKWAKLQLDYDLQEAAKKVQDLNLQPFEGGPG